MSRLGAWWMMLALPALGADDAVMRAMRDELARSMQKLQLENLAKPYFIAYRIVDVSSCTVSASLGAIIETVCDPAKDVRARSRNIGTDVRVGDYARDNSNFFAINFATGGVARPLLQVGGLPAPLDDNYDEIRRLLWLGTDSAYKNALDLYAKKKAALENRTRTDDGPDFSHEAIVNDVEDAPAALWDRPTAEALAKSVSAVFRETAAVDHSTVRLLLQDWFTRYVNSEGTSYLRHATAVEIRLDAGTQAVDGMPLGDFDAVFARSLSELPSRDELTRRARALAGRLERLRNASLIDRYTGPVLFEGQASAELLLQGLASALVGIPRVIDDRRGAMALMNSDAGLSNRVGARILPDFLSITDNPAAREFKGAPLIGAYKVDDDGVKSGPTVVVENGILKQLLHTRALIPGTTHSTASHRGYFTSPSNLFVTTEKGMEPDQLKAELLRVAKQRGLEYGVTVRRMANPQLIQDLIRSRIVVGGNGNRNALQLQPPIEAYKVFQDGHEELARNLEINEMTLQSFKDIIAVSSTPYLYTAPVRITIRQPGLLAGRTIPGGPAEVSIVAPSLLFEDMTLRRPEGDVPNLPFMKNPLFSK